ncbi:MAG: hypothetical protein P1Q69_19165, partial [Candidatus Thorarchaeota archaeon]|nr:hypothetical protein [Candidatus Thorarchaeota archaeon]
MPLLVILTLTLSTTTMILIQTASFEAIVEEELRFVLGGDVRVDCNQPLSFEGNLTMSPVVVKATPVISTTARIGDDKTLFLNGIDSLEYLDIGYFPAGCFIDEDPEAILSSLIQVPNGVIVSEYHANLLGKGVGDSIRLLCDVNRSTRVASTTLKIIGLMHFAPGFGSASTKDMNYNLLGSQLGFQAAHGGFALANIGFVENLTRFHNASMFLVDTVDNVDTLEFVRAIDSLYGIQAYSPETVDLLIEAPASGLFIVGLKGYLLIEGIACLIMGLASIGLFLGSAVAKRKSEYAVMRALGATQSQVRTVVF